LKTRIAANDAPDIISGRFDADYRLLVDENYIRDMTNEPVMDKVIKQYKDFLTYKGKSWMVPVSILWVGVFYNKDIFAENNISIPKTREEFYAVCDTLKNAGIQPLMVTDKELWTIGHAGTALGNNMYDTSKMMDVIHGNLSVRNIPGFSSYVDWLKRSRHGWTQADFLGTGYEAGLGDFANGKGAMLIQGNWIIPVLNKANPNFNYGVFPFPAAKEEDTKAHWSVDYALMLNASPKSDEIDKAAMSFLQFFVDKGAQTWADMDGSISCIEGIRSGLPQYQPMSDIIAAGKVLAGWYPDDWPAGSYGEYCIVQQVFLTDWNENAFYDGLDSAMKAYKDQP
jgi:raffinose/stachyose/melibiose transport system substrate-binding protein